jgi:hypothetical protein
MAFNVYVFGLDQYLVAYRIEPVFIAYIASIYKALFRPSAANKQKELNETHSYLLFATQWGTLHLIFK